MKQKVGRVEEGFVTVGGARIHYQRSGAGYPLVLLHGLVGSARNWHRNIHFLAQHANVFALDLCNMGESDRVPGIDPSLEATADRIVAAMDALGVSEGDVAGHSHGGAVAMMLAARHPDRVRRLILFAPANPYCNLGRGLVAFYQTKFGMWLAKQIPFLPRRLKAVALSRMYGDPSRVTDDALDGYIAGLGVPGTIDHILRIVRGWSADMRELRGELAKLAEKPTLLVWGDRDRAVGLASARLLQRSLKRSSLVVVPGAGHIPFEEMPEACNYAMRDWLSTPVAGKRSGV
ncbi:alpha/beta fold hydrolase [Edaphobacter bradus]|uniref:alpha/beta fold hydrolase n=1 Tax=Edaphobacter bradus TaxID=2259016 RepID=UPI0021E00ECC|nr:alpha/beta fold hydrolase [Edaphobacter bradus]